MNAESIREAFDRAGIVKLSPAGYEQLTTYMELLLRWNARFNLTAITDPAQILARHFTECAFAAQHLPKDIETLLDFGSGAGLPGIIFAVCRPEIAVTLAEAHGKKAAFLFEVVRTLGLGCEVYHGRVEDMTEGRVFDAVSMRAVEKMELAIPVATKRTRKHLVLFSTAKSISGFQHHGRPLEWSPAIALPNSDQMILVIGSVPEHQ